MRHAFKMIMAGALIAGTVNAQEKSTSVDGVLQQLGAHQGKAAPAVVAPAPVEAVKAAPAQPAAPARLRHRVNANASRAPRVIRVFMPGECKRFTRAMEAQPAVGCRQSGQPW